MLILERSFGVWHVELHHREGRSYSEEFLVRALRDGHSVLERASDRLTAVGMFDGLLFGLAIASVEQQHRSEAS